MSQTSRLVIIGITGRMGTAVSELASEFGFDVSAGVSRNGISLENLNPGDCDVVIDFSLPELTSQVLAWCLQNKKPLVSGVTGLTEPDYNAFAAAGNEIPVLWSPNMSVGVAILKRALRQLKPLQDYDFQVEEAHHRNKKDAPSGTAKSLQATLEETLGRRLPEPLSIRGGGIFGIHKVLAMGDEEILSFEHTALSRRVFARGALRAAQWLIKQPAGFYQIEDILQ